MSLMSAYDDYARAAAAHRDTRGRVVEALDWLDTTARNEARTVQDNSARMPELPAGESGPSPTALAYACAGGAAVADRAQAERHMASLTRLAEESRALAREVEGLTDLLPLPVAAEEMDEEGTCCAGPQEEPVYAPPEAAAAECEGVPACTGTRDCPVCGELPAGAVGVEDTEDDPALFYVPQVAANPPLAAADAPALVHVPQVVADAAGKALADPAVEAEIAAELVEPPGKKRPRGRRRKEGN